MRLDFYKKKIYELAFIEPVDNSKFSDCKWHIHKVVNPYIKEKWFADPFILSYDNEKIVVLVEEMDFKINRGRIAKLIIDRNCYTIIDIKILLDLPMHLSFPAIERIGEDVYVYPENSASGHLLKYKYNIETDEMSLEGIMVNEPLTDAIKRRCNGMEYVFSTQMPNPNGNTLYIYKKVNDDFVLFQKKVFADNTARGAGDWFEEDDRIIRPAQDCNGYYGIGLAFQEVNFDGDKFNFKEIIRIKHPKGYDGMHTFNKYKDLCIIDYRRPVYPYVYYPCKLISDIIRKIL